MTRNRGAIAAGLVGAALICCAAAALPDLDKLSADYRGEILALARDKSRTPLERSRGIVARTRTYTRELTDLQKAFLKKGDLKQATAVNDEVNRAMADKLLLAAIAVIRKAN